MLVALAAASDAGSYGGLAAGLGAAGAALVAAAVAVRRAGPVGWAVALSGAGFAAGRPEVSAWTAVAGGALLLAAELAYWSVEDDRRIRVEPAVDARRGLTLGLLVAGTLALDLLLLAASAVSASSGLLLAAVGVAAAVGAVALVLRLVDAGS